MPEPEAIDEMKREAELQAKLRAATPLAMAEKLERIERMLVWLKWRIESTGLTTSPGWPE